MAGKGFGRARGVTRKPLDLLRFCREDRQRLLEQVAREFPSAVTEGVPPATVLDEVIDCLGYRQAQRELPAGVMAQCDFDRKEIAITRRLEEMVRPNTDLEALKNFTKAHELAHIRLEHGEEIRLERDDATLPLFEEGPSPLVMVTYREEFRGRTLTRQESRREWEADLYASEFLVPYELLEARPEFQFVLRAQQDSLELPSGQLWNLTYALARWFHVSPTVMKHRLTERGLVVCEDRSLRIHPQALLQLEALEGAVAGRRLGGSR